MYKKNFIKYIFSTAIVLILYGINYCKAQNVQQKTIEKLNTKAENLNNNIDKQTAKYLHKLEKQEKRFYRKLAKLDSTAAKQLFAQSQEKYAELSNKVKNSSNNLQQKITDYLPGLDSATTALKFIAENPTVKEGKEYLNKAKTALQQYETLQQKIQSATDVKNIIKQRKEQLQQIAQKYNLTKHLGKYNKQAYYYSAQISEYKQALKDPQKAEQVVLKLLNKIPSFQPFFAQFSLMGQLFPMPSNGVLNMASLAGLQTRVQVQQQIQAIAGTQGLATINQTVQQAQSQLSQLKDKVQQAGGSSSDFDMPDFKPNDQKAKSFFKRFELKTDVQTTKGSNYFPNMADIALGLGYKLSSNKIIGIQAAYKLGLGNGFNNIKLTNQGLGIRSYADFKFNKKAGLWLTGGYERNFFMQPNLINYTGTGLWNEAAVAGLCKKYNLGKKRKGEMKIMYNFLWRSQLGAQQFIYRTGLNF